MNSLTHHGALVLIFQSVGGPFVFRVRSGLFSTAEAGWRTLEYRPREVRRVQLEGKRHSLLMIWFFEPMSSGAQGHNCIHSVGVIKATGARSCQIVDFLSR